MGFDNYRAGSISVASAALYVQKLADDRNKEAMSALVESIAKSFRQELKSIGWMDAKTKKIAAKKMAKMKKNVSHPKQFADKTLIERFIGGMNVSRRFGYFRNTLNLQKFDNVEAVKKLLKSPEETAWREVR